VDDDITTEAESRVEKVGTIYDEKELQEGIASWKIRLEELNQKSKTKKQ
jgi:hypothetical protein